MGTPVHRLASHTKHLHNTLRMKAFVAAVAGLAASANSQVLVNPYLGGHVYGGQVLAGHPLTYTGAPITTVAAAPVAIAAPAAPLSQQFHSQDEFTNFAHGYSNINSAKHEQGNAALGLVSGSYSYVDANGQLQTTNYQADGLGFRVQATNLPVAPVFEGKAPVFNPELPVAPVYTGVAPTFNPELPVAPGLTPEVAEATAAHLKALEEAGARKKRSTPAATAPLAIGTYAGFPFHGYGYAGAYGYNGAYAPHYLGAHHLAPLAYNAPLIAPAPAPVKAVVTTAPGAAEATLTKVKLNPGHAIAYRVD